MFSLDSLQKKILRDELHTQRLQDANKVPTSFYMKWVPITKANTNKKMIFI